MARNSVLDRHHVLFDAAAIAAHACFAAKGFRQKDLRFLFELFSNWLESATGGPVLSIQNTQIGRYLSSLVRDGSAKRMVSGKRPLYRLTRVGLMECLTRIVHRRHWWPMEEFLFVFHFVASYHARIEEIIKREGVLFPQVLKAEIRQLLDLKELVDRQEQLLDREIQRLGLRISDARKSSELAQSLIQRGSPVEQVVEGVQRRFPYQLNNQKPLLELFRETPEEDWLWQMETGAMKRVEHIFGPLREMLMRYRSLVVEMKRTEIPGKPRGSGGGPARSAG